MKRKRTVADALLSAERLRRIEREKDSFGLPTDTPKVNEEIKNRYSRPIKIF